MTTYRVKYRYLNKNYYFNVDCTDGDDIIKCALKHIKKEHGIKRLGSSIGILRFYVLTCDGCKHNSCGQLAHMGFGGCLS